MARFSFRTRNPQRDQQTDQRRLEGLLHYIRALRDEIEAERQGLNARFQDAQLSAAFAFETFENGEGDDLGAKADEMAVAMRRCEERIAALDRQLAFLRQTEDGAKSGFEHAGLEQTGLPATS